MPMGGLELLILLVIILLFFGAKRVPELARSLGKAKHEIHKGIEDAEAEEKEREKAETRQNKDEPPLPQEDREDGSVPEGEKPTAGPTSNT